MENKVLQSAEIKSSFEDLGSLNDFCSKFGACEVSIINFKDRNICLSIMSNEEIEFKLYCSESLSNIIKETNDFPNEFINYRVKRVTRDDGSKYIRLTQAIDIRMDPNVSLDEYLKLANTIKGKVNLYVKAEDMTTYKPKPINPSDLLAL